MRLVTHPTGGARKYTRRGENWHVPVLAASSQPTNAGGSLPFPLRLWCRLDDFDDGRLPRAVEDGLVGPIGAEPNREVPLRRRQPVRFVLFARRRVPEIDGQAAVGVVLQRLVLRPQRVAL